MYTLRKAEQWTNVVSNVAVVVSLIVAGLAYKSQLNQARRDVSIEYATKFNSGETLAAQRRLTVQLSSINLSLLDGVSVERGTVSDIISNMVDVSEKPIDTQLDIITVISSLDDVANCVGSGTCDEDVISVSLGETAKRSACLFLPYTSELRKRYLLTGLGEALKKFVDYEKTC